MYKAGCIHSWEMANVAAGLIVMKKCFHCGKVSTCFCFHDKPPLETSREQEHFWNFVEANRAFHFDIRCRMCGKLVKLDDLVGLMVCVGCDDKCAVYGERQKLGAEGGRVFIALGRRPLDERKQLVPEKLAVLEEQLMQQAESLGLKVRVVPHEMVRNIDSCYAEVVKDAESLFAAGTRSPG